MKAKLLIAAQFVIVLLYAKYGYNSVGEAAKNWARLFYISNQLIVCGWIFICYKGNYKGYVLGLNILLAIIWGQHYIPFLNYLIEVKGVGIYVFIMSYITCCLLIEILLTLTNRR